MYAKCLEQFLPQIASQKLLHNIMITITVLLLYKDNTPIR